MLKKAEIYEFEINLNTPIQMFGHTFSARKGLLLYLYEKNGRVGVAECMPLHGLNSETLEEAKGKLIWSLENQKFKSNITSVEYALDSAHYQLNKNFDSKYAQIFNNGKTSLKVQALMSSNSNDLNKEIAYVFDNKFTEVKLKIGKKSVDDEIYLINEICRKGKGKFKLRLDANKSLKLEYAVELINSIDKSMIEYIEEPLIHNYELNRFYRRTKINIALDESLFEIMHINQYDKYEGVIAYIIKPNMWGSLGKLYTLIILAKQHNIKPIFSSPFESGFGIYWQSIINKMFYNPVTSLGLDTYKFLENDILNNNLEYKNNRLIINEISSLSKLVNKERLNMIYEYEY